MKKTLLILGLILISYLSYSQYVIADGGNTITYSDRTTLINTMDKQGLDCRYGGGDIIEFVNGTGVVQVAYFSQITTPSRTTIYSLIEAVDSMIATYSTFSVLELNVDTINVNTDNQITITDDVVIDSTLTVVNSLFLSKHIEDTSPDSVLTINGDTVKQTATVSLDSITGDIGNEITHAGDAYITELRATYATHLFIYFGDSTISKSYTTSYQHLTNASNDMYIDEETDGFTISNDTITILRSGDYDLMAKHNHDGDNGETISMRFYNVTQAAGCPVSGANTTRGANNFMSTIVEAYCELTAGDQIVVQYKSDGNGTMVLKSGIIKIYYIHD